MRRKVGVIAEHQAVLTYETHAYDQEYAFADRESLPLLGINLLQGDFRTALDGPDKVIRSECWWHSMTRKLHICESGPQGITLSQISRAASPNSGTKSVFPLAATLVRYIPGSPDRWDRWTGLHASQHVCWHMDFIFTGNVDPGFLPVYQIALLADCNFSTDLPSELYSESNETAQNVGVLRTESAVSRFGINAPEDAIGQQFRFSMFDDKRTYVVTGVVEDFKFSPMASEINQIAIMQAQLNRLGIYQADERWL